MKTMKRAFYYVTSSVAAIGMVVLIGMAYAFCVVMQMGAEKKGTR